ncbi:MAG: HD domain-containing phosphohydrolase [Deltaproteobacteria bacterium]
MRSIFGGFAGTIIYVIDDAPQNLNTISKILTVIGYEVRTFLSGQLALEALHDESPDLILMDINMPGMNGYQVCEFIKADDRLKDIPVIFISALSEASDIVKGFCSGGVDYITKPFEIEEIRIRIETHLKLRTLQKQLQNNVKDLNEQVQLQLKEIADAHMAGIFAMAKLAHARDDDTGKHLDRVQEFCEILALGLSEMPEFKEVINSVYINNIFHASALHDIGKVAIPDNILLKPGELNADEFATMKKHTLIGSKMLEEVRAVYPNNNFYNEGIAIARSHHEKWDGSGYPDGIAGENIPLSARIMAVADVYDALKSKRCYKPAFEHERCCEILNKGDGTQFDPQIIKIFNKEHERFMEIWSKFQD